MIYDNTITADAAFRRPGERSWLSDLVEHKDLLLMLTWRDITIRYKQAVMGFMWALLMPILIIGSGAIVMTGMSSVSGRAVGANDILSVVVKAVPWAFIVAAIRFGTTSLVSNKELVTKIYFSRHILPTASVLASMFDFSVAASVVVIVLFFGQVGASIHMLWVPALLVILVMLACGLAILLSCANLFFRDIKYLVEIALTYGVFFTPVFYSSSTLGKWGPLLLLNPVGPILEALERTILFHAAPDLGWVTYSAIFALLTFFAGVKVFRSCEPMFAERV